MSNDSPMRTYRDGDWSRSTLFRDSPWWSPEWDGIDIIPDGPAEDDLGYQVSIYHKVRMDIDVSIGGYFPGLPPAPPEFSATAGSTVTRLPTGLYRVGYQIAAIGRGTSSSGFSETGQVLITNGVSKPRVTFPSAPPSGLVYSLYMTDNTGFSGKEMQYCSNITSSHVDLVTELWYTPFDLLPSPPIIDTVPGWPETNGSHVFADASNIQYIGVNFTALHIHNALTVYPGGGCLRIGSGRTITIGGDLWFAGDPANSDDLIIQESGSRIIFDNSRSIVPSWADYQIWSSGGGRILFIGGN